MLKISTNKGYGQDDVGLIPALSVATLRGVGLSLWWDII